MNCTKLTKNNCVSFPFFFFVCGDVNSISSREKLEEIFVEIQIQKIQGQYDYYRFSHSKELHKS